MKIAIIDYNAGNVASVANALERLGFEYVITRDPEIILSADKVIFPGQGRAGPAMENLKQSGLDKVLTQITKPFLGVCLGMQLLFDFSEEDGTKGLGIMPGAIRKFSEAGTKIPQIGWNTVSALAYGPLFDAVPNTFYAYFVNSYYAERSENDLAYSTYGLTQISSIVRKDNFYGIQFHPEKSGEAGLRLLKNFCELGMEKSKKTLVIPAIDIMGGKCVRLTQGDYDEKKIYDENPLAVARTFVADGAKYLHVIDLDGAREGKPVNFAVITRITKEVGVPIEAGGGIRTFEDAKAYLETGVERIIVSTAALDSPETLKQIVAEYGPGRIVVSVDAKNDIVATEGWLKSSEKVETFLKRIADIGITTIIYTDIERDGTLTGPNYDRIREVLKKPFRVIAAGGVESAQDVPTLSEMGAYGVVIGKALYENRIDLKTLVSAVPTRASVKPQRMVTKRIIPCMDIANGRVVKGMNFTNLRDAGDPVELAKRYSDEGADELVFLDITATIEERETLYALVREIAKNITIPFTVGGGVKTVEDIKRLLDAGADKASIGSAAVTNPDIVSEAALAFGSQCIVISVDPKRSENGSWEVYVKGGHENTGVDAIEFAKDMERRGAGELLVNSLDKDGTRDGYDLELLQKISHAVSIPVIASSGAGSREDFAKAFVDGKADAALAATLFHNGEIRIQELKNYLAEQDISVRI